MLLLIIPSWMPGLAFAGDEDEGYGMHMTDAERTAMEYRMSLGSMKGYENGAAWVSMMRQRSNNQGLSAEEMLLYADLDYEYCTGWYDAGTVDDAAITFLDYFRLFIKDPRTSGITGAFRWLAEQQDKRTSAVQMTYALYTSTYAWDAGLFTDNILNSGLYDSWKIENDLQNRIDTYKAKYGEQATMDMLGRVGYDTGTDPLRLVAPGWDQWKASDWTSLAAYVVPANMPGASLVVNSVDLLASGADGNKDAFAMTKKGVATGFSIWDYYNYAGGGVYNPNSPTSSMSALSGSKKAWGIAKTLQDTYYRYQPTQFWTDEEP